MRLLLCAALCLTVAGGERAWIDGKVTAVERKDNWGRDRHATLYRVQLPGEVLTVADIPQTIWSAAPAPHTQPGAAVQIEAPKGKWKSRVRVRFGAREKRLYFDSSSVTATDLRPSAK